MLGGDIEAHTGNAACGAGDMHMFLITSADATGTVDASPVEDDMVYMANDPASTKILTVDGTTKNIGDFGTSTTLVSGESIWLRYNGMKWLIVLLTRIAAGGGVTSHGDLDDLEVDDHSQYSKADGTRAFTGVVTGVAPSSDLHLATKKYVDDSGGGSSFLKNVLHYPPGQLQTAPIPTVQHADNGCHAIYLGRANEAITTITIRYSVITAMDPGGGSWAEAAIYKGTPVLGGAASLTRLGYTDIVGVVNSTGRKSTVISLSGVAATDHLWVIIGGKKGSGFGKHLASYYGTAPDELESGRCLGFTGQPSVTSTPSSSVLGRTVDVLWYAILW